MVARQPLAISNLNKKRKKTHLSPVQASIQTLYLPVSKLVELKPLLSNEKHTHMYVHTYTYHFANPFLPASSPSLSLRRTHRTFTYR